MKISFVVQVTRKMKISPQLALSHYIEDLKEQKQSTRSSDFVTKAKSEPWNTIYHNIYYIYSQYHRNNI